MSDLLLPGLNADHLALLEDRIRAFLASRELPLYRMMAYQMGWVDETGEAAGAGVLRDDRVHGQFVMAATSSAEGDISEAADFGISIELARNAALIHEDVEDGNTDRAGRPSVWWTWGPAQAINAGDGMHAMARLSLFSLLGGSIPNEKVSAALEALDDAVLSRCEGEYLDITYQERLTLSTDSYLEMAEGRSGSLLGGACALGAVAAGLSETDVAAFRGFGRLVGAARQVRMDVDSLWADRNLTNQGRLISKKKNLAIVYTLENGDAALRRKLGELYMQRVLDPAAIGDVAELAESAGSREFCQQAIEKLLVQAEACLQDVSIGDTARNQLVECAATVTSQVESSV